MFPYENLEVYKKAFRSNQERHKMIKSNRTCASSIKSQMGGAGLSIMLNIAEGSAKQSTRDRKNYFVTARGPHSNAVRSFAFYIKKPRLQEV